MRRSPCGFGVVLLVLLGTAATAAFGNGPQDRGRAAVEPLRTSFGIQAIPDFPITDYIIWLFAVYSTADSYPVDLGRAMRVIGVGVERSAVGIEPNPLSDMIREVGEKFGPFIEGRVRDSFGRLIEQLGPDLLADVDPVHLPPAFDVDNGRSDEAAVLLPTAEYILNIGSPENVGNGELSSITLGCVDGDHDDSDAYQLLSEILRGVTGANLDNEEVPGIDGVRLADVSLDAYTLALEDGGATDRLTLGGPHVEWILAQLKSPVNLEDSLNGLTFLEVGVDESYLGSWLRNPILDLVGQHINAGSDVRKLIDAVHAGDERIEWLGYDNSRISLIVHNGETGSADLLVLYGHIVEGVISSYR